jgi:hypothetical protein
VLYLLELVGFLSLAFALTFLDFDFGFAGLGFGDDLAEVLADDCCAELSDLAESFLGLPLRFPDVLPDLFLLLFAIKKKLFDRSANIKLQF